MQAKPIPCPECEELPITDFDTRDTEVVFHTYCPTHEFRGGTGRNASASIEAWNEQTEGTL